MSVVATKDQTLEERRSRMGSLKKGVQGWGGCFSHYLLGYCQINLRK